MLVMCYENVNVTKIWHFCQTMRAMKNVTKNASGCYVTKKNASGLSNVGCYENVTKKHTLTQTHA